MPYLPPKVVNVLRRINTDQGDVGPGLYKLPGYIAERLLSIGAAEEVIERTIDVDPEPSSKFDALKSEDVTSEKSSAAQRKQRRATKQNRMMVSSEHGDVAP